MSDEPGAADGATSFSMPPFWHYPPFYTLQPVKETQERQTVLWGQLILAWCKHNRVFVLSSNPAECPLFANPAINRRLKQDALQTFLEGLAAAGHIEWLDKIKSRCLVLWRKVPEWADIIHGFVRTYGLGDSVMLVDDLSSGDDVTGTELEGVSREVLLRALKLLESQGKARLFKGSTPEELGVKFM